MPERPFSVLTGGSVRQAMGRRGLVVVRKIKPSTDQQQLDERVNPLPQGFDYAPTGLFGTPDGSVYAAQAFRSKILEQPEDNHNSSDPTNPLPVTDLLLKMQVSQAGSLEGFHLMSRHVGLTAISTLMRVYSRDPTSIPAADLEQYLVHQESFLIPVVNTAGAFLEMFKRTGLERKFLEPFQGQSNTSILPGSTVPKHSAQRTLGAIQHYLYFRFSAWSASPDYSIKLEVFVEDRGF